LKHPYFIRKAQAYHISEKMSRIVILGENFMSGIKLFVKKADHFLIVVPSLEQLAACWAFIRSLFEYTWISYTGQSFMPFSTTTARI